MKIRIAFGITATIVLMLSSLAHAFAGWAAMREGLVAAQVGADLVGALGVGWHFGSVAMLTFGAIVAHAVWSVVRRRPVSMVPPRIVAVAYAAFGLGAFVLRNFNPHFLFFVATGVVVGIFAFWKQSSS